jgi:hypothetical protein
VGSQPPHSPFYLLGLPVLALAAWKDRRVRRLLFSVLAYGLVFLIVPPDARYLVAVLPLLSLALALSVEPFRKIPPRVLAALAVLAFLPGWLYAGYRLVRQGPVPTTAEARDRFLTQTFPVWPAVRFLNQTQGSRYTVYAFHAENMVYLADGRFLGDWIGLARFDRVLSNLRGPEDLHGRLRGLGAGYLLVPSRTELLPFPEDAEFRRSFEPSYADPQTRVYKLR